ncbi:translation initiation factor IF-3 [Mesoplasma lactucae]|uniref:Translation initiation factor IF-3 n=1 Tax=Mesoplasma lactucae ATCC 49193 TaxID=81460 RepID=A0A291IR68_9MOLU|nr:translation initiation factor IF-3 [Mesoplasma lactucae]ATG97234.1 translation initiation factor IF-3 [Mesoplasma lactucae ATCC 49193]ATZ20323.1 translation initiation factor IF-3 [Mesoplasma lactucae ATCC 49193]MCL8216494.1 Translation initiation factor IF-3 [Mesoplasma lactucae ATCC 49193]
MSQENRFQPRKQQEDAVDKAIRAREILIITDDGNKIGPISKREALQMAEDAGLNLLQVGQQGPVAIAKIVDYGKYKYEQQKKAKENKKHQTETQNKEIRLTVKIGEHDLDTKARKAREFIEAGDRVKVSLKFKGREIVYMDLGQQTLDRFYDKVSDVATIEKAPKLNTRFLDMYIVPKKKN